MRPLAVLIGIVMGSACALCVGLLLTWVTMLFLQADDAGQVVSERAPLGLAIGIFAVLTAVSALSFYGQVRERGWRNRSHLVLLATLGGTIWVYWPKK
jgi:hypothetical protein